MKMTTSHLAMVFSVLSLSLYQCKTPVGYTETAEVTFVESESPGLVTVSSTGRGEKSHLAEFDADEKVFRTIMYQGLPQHTGLRLPMVSTTSGTDEDAAKRFFEERDYERFITAQNADSVQEYKRPKLYVVKKTITVNYDALRRHLEKEGVTRKFGL
ncbi:MAG: hypothetical protein AAGI23_08060 [Bacteroidota bacterium]